jgi:hypothetical protein
MGGRRRAVSASVHVTGAEKVAGMLADAAAAMHDLTPANTDAARLIESAASARAPRRTGRLAASGRASGTADAAVVNYAVPYSGPIHNGWPAHNIRPNPFVNEAALAVQDQVLGVYLDYVNQSMT